MTFNNNKYGVLSNWTRVWFLRRVEKDGGMTLEYACVELDGFANSPSMLKALVGMVLLAENDWLYAFSAPSVSSPSRFFGDSRPAQNAQKKAIKAAQNYSVAPKNGTYPCLDLDLRLCDFQLSTARYSGIGSAVHASFLQESIDKPPLPVMCKIVDVIRRDDLDDMLNSELRTYAALQDLQGKVIPRLYGYYNVWGILDILALEPVGHAVTEDQTITPALRELMKSALGCIHTAGYLHGNITRQNFCIRQSKVFMVDLYMSHPSNSEAEKQAEMQQIDIL
jgi:hypothetical protein